MDKTIELAREAGAIHIHKQPKEFALVGNDLIKAFEALVRADEREIAIEDFKHRLASAIDAMPFGDTAASFAVFIRNFK